ncbi:MAG: response regulator transcription factor [Gaiella sp.]
MNTTAVVIEAVPAATGDSRSPALTCIVVDDHPGVLGAAARYLARRGVAVVATAATGASALTAALERTPDVVVVDLLMPGFTGGGLVAALREVSPRSRSIAYTGFGGHDEVVGALSAGAKGALLKGTSLVALYEAVTTVGAGSVYLEQSLTDELLDSGGGETRPSLEDRAAVGQLLRGRSPAAVAAERGIAVVELTRTVTAVIDRLCLTPGTAAAGAALRGLLGLDAQHPLPSARGGSGSGCA